MFLLQAFSQPGWHTNYFRILHYVMYIMHTGAHGIQTAADSRCIWVTSMTDSQANIVHKILTKFLNDWRERAFKSSGLWQIKIYPVFTRN